MRLPNDVPRIRRPVIAGAQSIIWPALAFASVPSGIDQSHRITHADDGSGRISIAERAGVSRALRDGGVLPTPSPYILADVRTSGTEEGLLSAAFPPGHDVEGYFHV